MLVQTPTKTKLIVRATPEVPKPLNNFGNFVFSDGDTINASSTQEPNYAEEIEGVEHDGIKVKRERRERDDTMLEPIVKLLKGKNIDNSVGEENAKTDDLFHKREEKPAKVIHLSDAKRETYLKNEREPDKNHTNLSIKGYREETFVRSETKTFNETLIKSSNNSTLNNKITLPKGERDELKYNTSKSDLKEFQGKSDNASLKQLPQEKKNFRLTERNENFKNKPSPLNKKFLREQNYSPKTTPNMFKIEKQPNEEGERFVNTEAGQLSWYEDLFPTLRLRKL